MPNCPSCGGEVGEGLRFCGHCGAAVDRASAPTETSFEDGAQDPAPVAGARGAQISSDSADRARFLPGTILAKRYRIIGLLGRGGMGEVYRADDLKLGQPVALKFLPAAVERDQDRLERFLNEVKTALKVSHPSVCRVHDIGEVDGQHYLSMEYVDGEDLASLLRRIGRMPEDKAVQIARQLCAGLAAAHEQGILHRDLKPANIMIDGRGRAKITDFGLASLAEAIEGEEVRAGTPGYMAPEQLAGKEVTVRSDLYSLGLVLYELFTGKRAFEAGTPKEMARLQEESTPTTLSSHVEGLSSTVEGVILRCLERIPEDRPASALSISASLPGGDPLAAALAAGETPSPEMVAAAGSTGLLRPAVAWPLVAIVLIAVGVMAWLGPKTGTYGHVHFVKPRQALEENARDIARNLGYTEAAAFSESWFASSMWELRYVAQQDPEPDWAVESDPIQRTIFFVYRQSPVPVGPNVDYSRTVAGAFVINLDLQGRLFHFRAVPRNASFLQAEPPPVDWSILFEASGLEIGDFEPTQARRHPEVFADSRRAWIGTIPYWGGMPVRVEAAATAGRPVYFETVVPWDSYWSEERFAATAGRARPDIVLAKIGTALWLLVFGGAVLIAYRNMRAGRGDPRGAVRLALFVLTLDLLAWLVAGIHVPGFQQELARFLTVLGEGLTWASATWILYMALEPSARKMWSGGLVSWNRLLGGRIGDLMVGRDVLIGLVAGVSFPLIDSAAWWIGQHYMEWPPLQSDMMLASIRGGRFLLGDIFGTVLVHLAAGLGLVMMFVIFHLILRKTWLAAGIFLLFITAFQMFFLTTEGISGLPAVAIALLRSGLMTIMLTRFGLLTLVAMWVSVGLFVTFPFTLDYTAPYFTSGLFGLLVFAALATLACRISLGRNLVFK